jgi:hypothetical protein
VDVTRAGDDAERSDEEERRMIPAGDDAERSDEEERRMIPAGDDAERSDEEEWRMIPPATMRSGAMRRSGAHE